jgi:hypothetical protein
LSAACGPCQEGSAPTGLIAAAVLGEVGADAGASIPALVGMLSEPPGAEMKSRKRRPDPMRWDPACRAALALGEIAPATPRAGEAAEALISVLRGPAPDARRAMAAEGLSRFGPEITGPALPLLLAVLNETAGKDGHPAPSICLALGRTAPGTPRAGEAVAALSAALHSGWGDTRSAAAKALAEFGPQARSALPRLRALGQTDPDPGAQAAAWQAAARTEGAVAAGTAE